MNQFEYIKERVDDQITWYGNKSGQSQKRYKRWRLVEIVAAALIPFLTSYVSETGSGPTFKVIVGSLGMLVAIIAGLLALYKFQESWVEYRSTCELLKSEKFLFETQAPPYDTPDAFPRFVQKIEALITAENQKWTQYITAASASAAAPAPAPPVNSPTPAAPAEPQAEVAATPTEAAAETPPSESSAAADAAPVAPVAETAPAAAEEVVTESNASAMQFDPTLTSETGSGGEAKP